MNKLFEQVREWADARNIIRGAKPIDQFAKLSSEFGELCEHAEDFEVCHDGEHDEIIAKIKDDIGDCLVVLTIITAQINMDVEVLMGADTCATSKAKHAGILRFGHAMGKLGDALLKRQIVEAGVYAGIAGNYLSVIAKDYGLDIEDCLQAAYDDIKDRKGVMYNGVFIKESDPAYAGAKFQVDAERNSIAGEVK